MQGPNRITSSATKIRSAQGKECSNRKQTPEGRIFVCCDAHGAGGKHGSVKDFWRGKDKKFRWS